MEKLLAALTKGAQSLDVHWASYTVQASFFLYFLGYLTLRFHLSALGIGTDLSVIDERYLFTGANFLIYLIVCVPILVLLVLLLVASIYLPYRILPAFMRVKVSGFLKNQWQRIPAWWLQSDRLAWLGIIFSLIMIEQVMRQCLMLSNLLLAENLPEELRLWLRLVLFDQSYRQGYFVGLLAGALISISIFYTLKNRADQTIGSKFLQSLFGFLLCVQLILIPVNYGILAQNTVPRVTGLDALGTLNSDEQAWLVWEGSESKTFLLRKHKENSYQNSLITLTKNNIKSLEISGYDEIFQLLFASEWEAIGDRNTIKNRKKSPTPDLQLPRQKETLVAKMDSNFMTQLAQIIIIDNFKLHTGGLRGLENNTSNIQGNLWLSKIDKSGTSEPKQITKDGNYNSPLWAPGSDRILVMKADKLIQLDITNNEEKELYSLSDATILIDFDMRNTESILISQNSVPAVLSLVSGETTLLPYDGKNIADRNKLKAIERGLNNYRNYRDTAIVNIEKNIIYVDIEDKKEEVLPSVQIECPADCVQPALSEDMQKLVFVN